MAQITVREKLTLAVDLLTSFLLENTEEVFEEINEVDEARAILQALLENGEV